MVAEAPQTDRQDLLSLSKGPIPSKPSIPPEGQYDKGCQKGLAWES